MWAFARYDLRLSDDEFGGLSYAQLEVLVDRYKEDQRRQFLHSGIVASAIINMLRAPDSKPVKPTDFVPDLSDTKNDLSKMSGEEVERHFLAMFSNQMKQAIQMSPEEQEKHLRRVQVK